MKYRHACSIKYRQTFWCERTQAALVHKKECGSYLFHDTEYSQFAFLNCGKLFSRCRIEVTPVSEKKKCRCEIPTASYFQTKCGMIATFSLSPRPYSSSAFPGLVRRNFHPSSTTAVARINKQRPRLFPVATNSFPCGPEKLPFLLSFQKLIRPTEYGFFFHLLPDLRLTN